MPDGGNIDLKEVKEAVDTLGQAWEEYQKTNDERLKQIEQRGSADPLTEEKLAKLTAGLDKFEQANQSITKALEEQKAAEQAAKEAAEAAAKAGEEKDAATKEQLARIETALNRTDRGGASQDETKAKEAMDLFLKCMRTGDEGLDAEEMKIVKETKALSVADDSQAGYLAPKEFVGEIIKGIIEFSPIRALARVRTTSRRAIQIPRRTGVFAAVWTAETGTRSETTGLTYGLEDVPTHEASALVDVSEQMLEDSEFNLEQELQLEFTEQFGVTEGTAFVNGTATGQPEGFMTNGDIGENNSGSAADISDSSGQANGLIDLMHAIFAVYAANATWLLNRKTLGSVRKLKDGNNNYIWQPGIVTGQPNTILGVPYMEATDMADEAANAFPMAFGDFRKGYTIVDRVVLSVLRDPFTQATSGNVRFVARKRVGGQVVLPEAIRKLKCSV